MKKIGIGSEWSAIFKSKRVLIPVIAVMLIPLLYCGMFLWAFWNPYAKMNVLPVAVVNSDAGAEFQGKSMHVGEDFIANLKKNDNFDWQFVTKQQAEQGLANRKYYMAIEVPEDFTRKVTTVLDEKPEQAQIMYIPNESYNFLAAQIGLTAMEKIKSELSTNVTKAYAETVFSRVGELSDGLGKAGDGAGKLADGSRDLNNGILTVKDNMAKLMSGALNLQSGVQLVDESTGKLAAGAAELSAGLTKLDNSTGGLVDGVKALQQGAKAVDDGLSRLATGAAPLKDGVTALQTGADKLSGGLDTLGTGANKLAGGLEQAATGGNTLADGADQAAAGATKLTAGLTTAKDSLSQLATASEGLSNGLNAYMQAHPELANDATLGKLLATSKTVSAGMAKTVTGQEQLIAGAKQVDSGASQLATGLKQLSGKLTEAQAGSKQLAAGADQLTTGATQLKGGLTSLSGGADQLLAGTTQLQAGTHKLAAGADQLAAGTGQLTTGTHKLAGGAAQLASGTAQLDAGTAKLAGGAEKLANGITQLDAGTDKLVDGSQKVADGNAELATKLTTAKEATSSLSISEATEQMFAAPVAVAESKYTEVPNYGTGFSPYFISLGLFVGALVLTVVFPMKQPAVMPKSGVNWFLSKFAVIAGVGIVQALCVDAILLGALQLKVQSIPLFIVMTIITSMTFMTIIQFLVTAFADVGRFIAIVMLIFQLTTSAGTFPVELLPGFLQHFHKLLPMTYSVFGFKDVISSGNFTAMWENAGMLLVFIAAFALLSLVYLVLNFAHNQPEPADESKVSLAL